mmetsp:Transcript_29793/g.58150  ORF Transcript_29793/g.58150 Transcript_29793/m.58150 type:complete len:88 (+) Transcript_29793:2675-2938(+)
MSRRHLAERVWKDAAIPTPLGDYEMLAPELLLQKKRKIKVCWKHLRKIIPPRSEEGCPNSWCSELSSFWLSFLPPAYFRRVGQTPNS